MSGRIVAHSNLIEVRQGDSFNIIVQIKKSHPNKDVITWYHLNSCISTP